MRAFKILNGFVDNFVVIDDISGLPEYVDADIPGGNGNFGKIGDLWDGTNYTTPALVVPVPNSVTRYQIRVALINRGKIADVKTVVDNSADLLFIEYWGSNDIFKPSDVHLITMAAALGFSQAQVDVLLKEAALIL